MIDIEKGATDRRSAPETYDHEKVTVKFLRLGRLLFRIYDLNDELYDDADQGD